MFRWIITCSLLFIGVTASRLSAQETEILRGKVTDQDGKAISGAELVIIGARTRMVRKITTNTKGIYTTFFTTPESEYLITARMIGFAPKTVRVLRSGASTVLVTDFKMEFLRYLLDPIIINARPLPTMDDHSTDGTDVDLLARSLYSLDALDFRALAASIPGVQSLGDSGFSVLGTSPDQNNITIDGSTTSMTGLPRDAIGSAVVSLTPFDGSKGRFSGGQLSVTTKGGTDVVQANARGSATGKHFIWEEPGVTSNLPRNFATSGSLSGPIKLGKAHYFASYDIQNSSITYSSLFAPDLAFLNKTGLKLDTVQALTSTLISQGVPTTSAGIPDDQTNHRATSFVRFDYSPSGTISTKLQINWSRTVKGGSAIQASAFPGVGTQSRDGGLSTQFKDSRYFAGILNEFTTAAEHITSSGGPYLSIPAASVLVGTVFDSGRTGLTTLQFGGGSGTERVSSNWSWETNNEMSWITLNNKHRFKVGENVRLEANRTTQSNNRYGTYTYQTMQDLRDGLPASYTRTLTVRERTSNAISGALWLGDDYRFSNNLQFQGSLRFDVARPGTVPDYNPLVDSLFNRHTDRVPHTLGLAPRLGFTWTPNATVTGNARGTVRGRPITFTGGVGAFRGIVSSGRIVGMVDQTGLPTTTRSLTCVRGAAPAPDWSGSSPLPDACIDGTEPTDYSSSQPNVAVFDPTYQTPLSWRGTLGITGLRLKGVNLTLNSTYALGSFNESQVNLNQRTTTQFNLADESGRPVYVQPSDIVPETGAIAPGATLIHPEFQRVSNLLSDLSSRAAQVSLNIAPVQRLLGKVPVSFTYTWQHGSAQERGIQGSTDGNPFIKQWAPGRQPTHTLTTTLGFNLWWFQFSTRLNLQSGTPYTPMVGGDINGDGVSNDRAFIPIPGATVDTALAGQMRSLLSSAPPEARRCLESQFGRIAARNSCRTNWQFSSDLGFNFNPPKNFGFGDRLRLTMSMQNTTGAIVRILGLEDSPFSRSAAVGPPDTRLLYVTGFNTTTQNFNYRVNQLFGERADATNHGGHLPSFQVTLGLEYRLGGPPAAPMARSLGLFPADRGPALTRIQVRDKLRALIGNPVLVVLSLTQRLALTTEQTSALQDLNSAFLVRSDSVLAPTVEYVFANGRKISDDEVRKLLTKAQPGIQAALVDVSTKAVALLTPEQQKKLPGELTPAKKS